MNIEKEDFEQWLGHPVTEQVMRVLRLLADAAKEKWLQESWDGGNNDPLLLADLRARAEVVKDLTELKYEDIEAYLNDEYEQRASNRVQGAGLAKAN